LKVGHADAARLCSPRTAAAAELPRNWANPSGYFGFHGRYKPIAHLPVGQENAERPPDFAIRIVADPELEARHVLESCLTKRPFFRSWARRPSSFRSWPRITPPVISFIDSWCREHRYWYFIGALPSAFMYISQESEVVKTARALKQHGSLVATAPAVPQH